ncbi:hypothetical protein ACFL1U_00525 [Patescibacteria group bacterium]
MAKKNTTPLVQTMQSSGLANRPGQKQSTQMYLDVQEIREGTVVLKDGALRSVLLVSSMNFALKSYEEQEAIILGYQGFLNSLDFPIQIVMQSRVLDITEYIAKLAELEKQQSNELLRIQTASYGEYIGELVKISNIMNKNFYIVVSFSPVGAKKDSFFGRLGKIMNPTRVIKQEAQKFAEYKSQLEQRVMQVQGGLGAVGLKSLALGTQELIELLYQSYNTENVGQKSLPDIGELDLDQTS